MTLLLEIAAFSLAAFAAMMLALQFLALWGGFRAGRWQSRRMAHDQDTIGRVGAVVGGLLGLLAFTLGLAIGIASDRYNDRRAASLEEANAIGTAWLRAGAIGHPRGEEIARLLEGYLRERITWVSASRNAPELARAAEATDALQGRIWGHAAAILQERTDPVAVALQGALNEVFDAATKQRWAFEGQMPRELPWLLLALTVSSVAALGYQWGLQGKWHPLVALLLLGAWAACLTMVVDLARPRIGAVRVDVAVYEWTLRGFQGGVVIPPAPVRR
jgi:hypothetical protein